MTDKSGIYCFYFLQKPNEFYIGKGASILVRVQNHISALKRGNHVNSKIQNYYNKYGLPNFEVLEECGVDILVEKEKEYIEEFNSFHEGLNLTNGGEGGGFGEGLYNSSHSNKEYYEVLCLIAYTDYTLKEISELTGVSKDICKHISGQSAHNWLQEFYPKEYEIVKQKKYTRDGSACSKGIQYPTLVDPLGNEYTVGNVHKFAEEHGLQYQNLHKVLTGKRKKHLNWMLKEKYE